VSESTETSSDEGDEQRISVRRLVPIKGLTSRQVVQAVRDTLNGQPVQAISVVLVDDATIASLHERYMGDPRPTDVLTFDLRDTADEAVLAGQTRIEGEIIASVDTARTQANRLGIALHTELLRYVIHGVLHLLGLNDDTRAGRTQMRRAENRILAGLSDKAPKRKQPQQTKRKEQHAQRRISGGV